MRTIFSLLVCLQCHHSLAKDGDWLVCYHCRIKYPIIDGIPHMIKDAMVPLEKEKQQ